jgi:hypothetical protein
MLTGIIFSYQVKQMLVEFLLEKQPTLQLCILKAVSELIPVH